MATVTSHALNGSDGTHAGGIEVTLTDLGKGTVLFDDKTDAGGRLSRTIPGAEIDATATYQLIFHLDAYWQARAIPARVTEIALRFTMPDPDGAYHMPVIFNPNSYSVWSSA